MEIDIWITESEKIILKHILSNAQLKYYGTYDGDVIEELMDKMGIDYEL